MNDVWGLDKSGYAFHYQSAGGFEQLLGTQTYTQIAAGGDGVWGINPANSGGQIVRFDPNVENIVPTEGVLSQISSGSGAGVWGVNSAGQIFLLIR